MNAIKFKEHNVVFGENQKEYSNLPAHVDQSTTIATFGFRLEPSEVAKVVTDERIRIIVLNFNRPVQPIRLSAIKPVFPLGFKTAFRMDAESYNEADGTATFKFELTKNDLINIKASKMVWISIITYGTALQPVGGSIA